MAKIDRTYSDLVSKILVKGYDYEDPNRKGVNRRELMHYTLEHDLTESFPAITLKKLAWKSVVTELLWFLSGSTNIKPLVDKNVNIWNQDAYKYYISRCREGNWAPGLSYLEWRAIVEIEVKEFECSLSVKPRFADGELGRVYGAQWRDWEGSIDQITKLINNMRENPLSTSLLVTAWNPAEVNKMALPPCHYEFQIVGRPLDEYEQVITGKKFGFALVWSQRSVDTFLGLPFNIASYALLAHILGKLTNTVPLQLIGNLKNVHLYDNSISEAEQLVSLDVDKYSDVQLSIANNTTFDAGIDDFLESVITQDFVLQGYESYPPLKVEMLSRDLD